MLKLKMQNEKLKTYHSTFIILNFLLPLAYRPFKHAVGLTLKSLTLTLKFNDSKGVLLHGNFWIEIKT